MSDKIRAAFEKYAQWAVLSTDKLTNGDYQSLQTRIAWSAYQKGQRDMIAAMQPMGWKVGLCVYDNPVEAERHYPMPVIPLYMLPEVGE